PGSNQGSISVFNIGSAGTLTPIPGSPFLSGGTAPVSLSLVNNDSTLIVANRDELAEGGVQGPVAGGILNNYVSFKVSSSGAISAPITTLPVPATSGLPFSSLNGVTQVLRAPSNLTNKTIVFAVEEGDAIRSFQVNADSTFSEVPGSPFHTPADGMGPFTGANAGAGNHVPLGMDVHPNQPIIYVNDVKIATLLVYTYTPDGVLTYSGFVPNANGVAACWVKVDTLHSKVYTADTLTNSVSVFDISANPLMPVQLAVPTPGTTAPGNVVLSTDGDPYQLALDPQMQFLYVTNPRNFDPNVITGVPRPLSAANTEHVLKINADGTLTEVSSVKIPNSNGLNIEGGLAL
ncbi:MAG: lactonase family protein, partial [Armatimonadota bacterium]|nr:lactonase family protein [Armatimonadota bacterium]